MTVWCQVCDDPTLPGESTMRVAGQLIHRYCSIEGGDICLTDGCPWQWTDHVGPHE